MVSLVLDQMVDLTHGVQRYLSSFVFLEELFEVSADHGPDLIVFVRCEGNEGVYDVLAEVEVRHSNEKVTHAFQTENGHSLLCFINFFRLLAFLYDGERI